MKIVSIVQAVTSIVAIVISVITLYRDHLLYKINSRPYVICTVKSLTMQGITYCYLTLENFGQSGAYITEVSASPGLKSFFFTSPNNPFSHMKNQLIAPRQRYVSCLCILNREKEFFLQNELDARQVIEQFDITLRYSDLSGKNYSQTTHHSLVSLKDISTKAPEPIINSQDESRALDEVTKAIYVTQAEKIINDINKGG